MKTITLENNKIIRTLNDSEFSLAMIENKNSIKNVTESLNLEDMEKELYRRALAKFKKIRTIIIADMLGVGQRTVSRRLIQWADEFNIIYDCIKLEFSKKDFKWYLKQIKK